MNLYKSNASRSTNVPNKLFKLEISVHQKISLKELTVQFSSVAQSCPTLCNPMNHSMLGLPIQHQLPEFTQTHVHRVSDAIQPSHPLSSPSPPALNLSQHQGLFSYTPYKVVINYKIPTVFPMLHITSLVSLFYNW